MNNNNPEILTPGGDFNSAIHGLKNGSDAVYIGLKHFSARKKATNFTLTELRQLKTFCVDNNKKIYVAINTLLKEEELQKIYPILKELEEIEIDGIIAQDLGLINLINKKTNLVLHASTQLAIHNYHGIKTLKKLGFKRVVLSRELSFLEIKYLKESFPNMEFEIFIHGALCYGFSGMCLASSRLLNRSANKGECGQICRTWFNNNGKKEYCFSLNDLALKKNILKLKEIGIESLKIEGRLKGPGYTSATATLYNDILYNKDYTKSLKQSLIEFNRSGSDAYLFKNKNIKKINTKYPSHTGIKIGEIISKTENNFTAKLLEDIYNRDGLLIPNQDITAAPLKLGVNILSKKGLTFKLKGKIGNNYEKDIFQISSHNKHLKEEKPQSYKPWKTNINLDITFSKESLIFSTSKFEKTYPFNFEKAEKTQDIKGLFHKMFYAGGKSNYNFTTNIKSKDTENYYLPLSKLKIIRNSFQEDFVKRINNWVYPSINNINIPIKEYIRNNEAIPFVTNFNNINIKNLSKYKGNVLLPLNPVIFDSELYLKKLQEYLKENSETTFIIGLNNLSHLEFIHNLPENQKYFCDYGLYSLNKYSIDLLSRFIPNLLWVTKWIEESKDVNYPPIFISRTCFKAQQEGCPKNCAKSYTFKIKQNKKSFIVKVEDCISYTFIDF